MAAVSNWRLTNNASNPKALQYIDIVRTRGGMPAFTAIDQQVILDESARELNFEGGRRFLLKRMGVLFSQVKVYQTFGSAKSNEAVYPMQPHMVRWPIPRDQIDSMAPNFHRIPDIEVFQKNRAEIYLKISPGIADLCIGK